MLLCNISNNYGNNKKTRRGQNVTVEVVDGGGGMFNLFVIVQDEELIQFNLT